MRWWRPCAPRWSRFKDGDYRLSQPRWQSGALEANRALFGRMERLARLAENIVAAGIRLSDAERAALAGIFAPDSVMGARYDAAGLALLEP